MLLQPLADAIGAHLMAASKLHADNTPVPVLDAERGRTKTGRLCTGERDDRLLGSGDPRRRSIATAPTATASIRARTLRLRRRAPEPDPRADANAGFEEPKLHRRGRLLGYP